jgi:hypothetical protein
MKYYATNAMYEQILSDRIAYYKFTSGNAWQLVYGDQNSNPLLLIYAKGVNENEYLSDFSDQDKEAVELLSFISKHSALPLLIIKFRSDLSEINEVLVSEQHYDFKKVSLAELSNIYKNYGLPVSNTPTDKYLNDRTSSAYHNWQRSCLGKSLTVSDIDLWKVDENGTPKIIFELKRSYYSIERWNPFPEDYNNFMLVWQLCFKSSISFKIAYNVRTRNPFFDDISKIKIFSVDFMKNPSIIEENIVSLNDFLIGRY